MRKTGMQKIAMQKIVPFLWFDDRLEEAMEFYTSIFKNSSIGEITRYAEGGPFPPGKAMSAVFYLDGVEFMGLNGGPQFKFTEAVSFFVKCQTQEEVDELWEKLSEGGEVQMCGWLKDKYGLSWQIIPTILGDLLNDEDPAKAGRVADAMLQMVKIDIQGLLDAYSRV